MRNKIIFLLILIICLASFGFTIADLQDKHISDRMQINELLSQYAKVRSYANLSDEFLYSTGIEFQK